MKRKEMGIAKASKVFKNCPRFQKALKEALTMPYKDELVVPPGVMKRKQIKPIPGSPCPDFMSKIYDRQRKRLAKYLDEITRGSPIAKGIWRVKGKPKIPKEIYLKLEKGKA